MSTERQKLVERLRETSQEAEEEFGLYHYSEMMREAADAIVALSPEPAAAEGERDADTNEQPGQAGQGQAG